MITIEKNVPLPTASYKYPFDSMELGDSFHVKTNKISASVYVYNKANKDKKFVSRKDGDGYRVWRTK